MSTRASVAALAAILLAALGTLGLTLAGSPAGGTARAGTILAPPPPVFTVFPSPPGMGEPGNNEPSIGANPKTGAVLFQSFYDTLRVRFADSSAGPTASWTDVTDVINSLITLDPILYTDKTTGRTFVSQLLAGCSMISISDDDGETWTENPVGCGIASGADHQTIGVAPKVGADAATADLYPNLVLYCSQQVAYAACARSLDGGMTFGPAIPVYSVATCHGLHGHVQGAPDGTLYLPLKGCSDDPVNQALIEPEYHAVAVSTDGGLTWTVHRVPGMNTLYQHHPHLAIGSDGTVYFIAETSGVEGKTTFPLVSVSRDKGVSWSPPVNLGTPVGVNNTRLPLVVAGDGDRATAAFVGTPAKGDPQLATFKGNWSLYVATTYDRGATWEVRNVTGDDPVQRGCIWALGGDNPCRNLLDFNEITIDAQGRPLIAFSDGCYGQCVTTDNPDLSRGAKATIARLTSGRTMFARFDATLAPPVEVTVPDPAPPTDTSSTGSGDQQPQGTGSQPPQPTGSEPPQQNGSQPPQQTRPSSSSQPAGGSPESGTAEQPYGEAQTLAPIRLVTGGPRLRVRFARFGGGARARNRSGTLALRIRTLDGRVRNLRAVMVRRGADQRPFAVGTLRVLKRTAVVRLRRLRTFTPGRYVVVLTGVDRHGDRGRATANIRLS
jgi:hypothetical protein